MTKSYDEAAKIARKWALKGEKLAEENKKPTKALDRPPNPTKKGKIAHLVEKYGDLAEKITEMSEKDIKTEEIDCKLEELRLYYGSEVGYQTTGKSTYSNTITGRMKSVKPNPSNKPKGFDNTGDPNIEFARKKAAPRHIYVKNGIIIPDDPPEWIDEDPTGEEEEEPTLFGKWGEDFEHWSDAIKTHPIDWDGADGELEDDLIDLDDEDPEGN